jgi:hypothetical protein
MQKKKKINKFKIIKKKKKKGGDQQKNICN